MEFSLFNFSFPPLVVTFSVTLLCCLLTILFSLRFSFRKPKSLEAESTASGSKIKSCSCSCSCNGVVLAGADYSASLKAAETYANGGTIAAGGMGENGPVVVAAGATVAERQTGASMMEQLVPEITTHALSYLDYPSLCRLSMTNSQMRKAANDDNAWKALYHKDYTLEQDGVRPANGWKAYYAATRAIVNINAEFFNIIRDRSLSAMSCFWLNADYVKCIHASGELFSGYNAVMQSWQIAFNWEQQQGNGLQIRDVRTRVLTDMAWVTMKTYVDVDTVPYNVTNVFEFHNGRWYMVHHHCSLMLADGDDDQQIVHA